MGFILPAEGPFLACVSRPVVYMLWLTSSRLEVVVGGWGCGLAVTDGCLWWAAGAAVLSYRRGAIRDCHSRARAPDRKLQTSAPDDGG